MSVNWTLMIAMIMPLALTTWVHTVVSVMTDSTETVGLVNSSWWMNVRMEPILVILMLYVKIQGWLIHAHVSKVWCYIWFHVNLLPFK